MIDYQLRKATTDNHGQPVRIGHRVDRFGLRGIVTAVYNVRANGAGWHEVAVELEDGRTRTWDASQTTRTKR